MTKTAITAVIFACLAAFAGCSKPAQQSNAAAPQQAVSQQSSTENSGGPKVVTPASQAEVTGVFVDGSGKPVSASAELIPFVSKGEKDTLEPKTSMTDSSGHFVIGQIPPGNYCLMARVGNSDKFITGHMKLGAGDRFDLGTFDIDNTSASFTEPYDPKSRVGG